MESDMSMYTTADGADGRQIIIKLSRWTVTDRLRGAFSTTVLPRSQRKVAAGISKFTYTRQLLTGIH